MSSYLKTSKNTIKVFNKSTDDSTIISGEKLGFHEPYPNIALFGKKKSGKTTILINIMLEKMSTDTKVYIFSPTFDKDRTWINLRKYMDKKGIDYEAYPSIYDEEELENGKIIKVNVVNQIYKSTVKGGRKVEVCEDCNEEITEKDKEVKKKNVIYPKILCIFDDISEELRDKSVEVALKKNRHFLACNIISTQSITDLKPNSINQLDYVLIWHGLNDERLFKLYENLKLSVDYDEFLSVYSDSTSEKYGFLLIDVRNDEFRRNFG